MIFKMSKKVCIIGAGPSGLVAAKTLLHDAPNGVKYDVTIFDAQSRIGGLWPTRRDDDGGLVHPLMIANQSRHTMYFSDFAWPDTAPQIPRAFQVGSYLERYRQRYCQDVTLRLECRVEKADLVTDASADGNGHSWHVKIRPNGGDIEEHDFDYLVLASGYFGEPAVPRFMEGGKFDIPVVHSSKYRNLEQLLGNAKEKKGKILVVGGQLSGVEIAGTIATHISDAINAPGPRRDNYIDPETQKSKFSVQHLVQRSTWLLPLTSASTPASPTPHFLPLDINFQNLSNRPPGPLKNVQGHIPVEQAKVVNTMYRDILRTDQAEYSPLLQIKDNDYEQQPFLGISDTYADFARAGVINVSKGKLASLAGNVAGVQPSGEQIEDVAAIVLATGFKASASLSFLSEELQQILSIAPTDLNNTVALAFHNTHHPQIPNLGFVGFYRSPYWGAIEMHARFVTNLFSYGGPSSDSLPTSMAEALKNDDSIQRTLELRKDTRASQFPMGDYAWLMQEFARALDIERRAPLGEMPILPPKNIAMNVLTTARYPGKELDEARQKEVELNLTHTEGMIRAGINGERFLARAVFRALLGEWKLERDIVSELSEQPSGKFTGTAKFMLRNGTPDGRQEEYAKIGQEGGDYGFEYLYIEDGEFVDEAKGLRFNATRRYIWRYDERKDKLSVWFVKPDEDRTADYLFHEVDFVPSTEENAQDGWKAKGSHLCVEDMYNVDYKFAFQSVNLREWNLAYSVKGPKKDYSINGVYRR